MISKRTTKKLKTKLISYHERLLMEGYNIRGFYNRRDLHDAFDSNVEEGLMKIVIIPINLVPEVLKARTEGMDISKRLKIKNEGYVRYQK